MIYILVILICAGLALIYNNIGILINNDDSLQGRDYSLLRKRSLPFVKRVLHVLPIILIVLILSLFGGVRAYDVGTDTYSIYYQGYYANYCLNGNVYTGSEIGFYLILRLGYALFRSYTGVLLIVSALTAVFFVCGLLYFKNRVDITYVILIYLCLVYFDSFNIQRQFLAASIIIFGLRFLDRKRYWEFILTALCAFTVHVSSIVCVVLLLFKLFENKNKLLVALCVVIIAAMAGMPLILNVLTRIPFFNEIFPRSYLDQINFDISLTNLSLVILYLPVFAVVAIFGRKLIKLDKRNKLYVLMVFMSFICALLKIYMVWYTRFILYFSFSFCLTMPQCFNKDVVSIYKERKWEIVLKVCVIVYSIAYFIINYIILGNGMIYPYHII